MNNCFIGKNVKIGNNVQIGRNVIIENDVTIEDNCVIGHGVVIGQPPQHLQHKNKKTGKILIKSGAYLREYVTVNLPINEITRVGEECFIMNHVNIGHDIYLGSHVVVSSGAQIGGHCYIDDNVNLGLNCSIHQRSFIGAYSMIGMNTSIKTDVLPFSLIYKEKSGYNMTGITRSKYKNMATKIVKYIAKGTQGKFENPEVDKYFENYRKKNIKL